MLKQNKGHKNMRVNWLKRQRLGFSAILYLFSKWNCSAATMIMCQKIMNRDEDLVHKAIQGFEGGILGCGSTCGIALGGAIGLGLLNDDLLQKNDIKLDEQIINLTGKYIKLYEKKAHTTLCSKRSNVNFWSRWGNIKYLILPNNYIRCSISISDSIKNIFDLKENKIKADQTKSLKNNTETFHCAKSVLEGIREKTGIGNDLIERISIVLDGGVGLQGGACGALTGAVMAVYMIKGLNMNDESLNGSLKAYFGDRLFHYLRTQKIDNKSKHIDLLLDYMKLFKRQYKSIECDKITNNKFTDWEAFQNHMESSNQCKEIVQFSIDTISEVFNHLNYERER
jgi:hypothetical protein